MQQVIQMAKAAMDAEDQKQSWCMRMLRCCVQKETAVLCETAEGDVQLKQLQETELVQPLSPLAARTLTRNRTRSSSISGGGMQSGGASGAASRVLSTATSGVYRSPNASFSQGDDCMALDMRQLEIAAAQVLKDK
jgi:hypothetical protein